MTARRLSFLGCVLIVGFGTGSTQGADPLIWLRGLESAKVETRASGKDLFLLFTGVGWCQPCMDFDRKVLKQPAFLDQVRKEYALVEFDHTFGDTPAEKDRQSRFAVLEKKYLINAFPTVVLADSGGTPYAVMTGYEGDVPAMLDWIAKAGSPGPADREFRAGRLHQGIQAVAGLLATLEERGDDPVLVYYKDKIAEIARLDAGGAGKVYDDRRAARDRRLAEQAVFDRVRKFDEAKDYRGAVAFLDEALKTATDRAMRSRLEHVRVNCLERDHRDEEALASVRESLRRTELTADERYQFMFHEAANLFRLGRVDAGIAVWDRCIAAADTPEKRVRRLDWKASMIPIKTHRELKMAAWRACRTEAPRGSDQWMTATYFLADDARKAGRTRRADFVPRRIRR